MNPSRRNCLNVWAVIWTIIFFALLRDRRLLTVQDDFKHIIIQTNLDITTSFASVPQASETQHQSHLHHNHWKQFPVHPVKSYKTNMSHLKHEKKSPQFDMIQPGNRRQKTINLKKGGKLSFYVQFFFQICRLVSRSFWLKFHPAAASSCAVSYRLHCM